MFRLANRAVTCVSDLKTGDKSSRGLDCRDGGSVAVDKANGDAQHVRQLANAESRCVAAFLQRSPRGRPQKRPHKIQNTANCSKNSTWKPTPSLPWAQGVAGSNPVAPTTSLHNVQSSRELAESRRCDAAGAA